MRYASHQPDLCHLLDAQRSCRAGPASCGCQACRRAVSRAGAIEPLRAGRSIVLDLGALTRGRWLCSAVFGLSPRDVCVTLVADRAFGNLAKSVDYLAPSGAIRLKRSPCSLAEDHRRVSARRRGDVDVAESKDLGVDCIDFALDLCEHFLGHFSERRMDGQCLRESSGGFHECRAGSMHEPNLPQSDAHRGGEGSTVGGLARNAAERSTQCRSTSVRITPRSFCAELSSRRRRD